MSFHHLDTTMVAMVRVWSRLAPVVLALAGVLLTGAATPAQAKPDLKVAFMNPLSEGVTRGGPFIAKTRLKNSGDDAAPGSEVSYMLSTDRRRGGDLALGSRRAFGPLMVGRSERLNVVLTPPPLALGRFYLIACADGPNAVAESNERNNCRIGRGPIAVTLPALLPEGTQPAGSSGTPSPNPPTGGPTTPAALAAPTGLHASSPSADQIDLNWDAVTDAATYSVRRGNSAAGPFTEIGSATAATFSDTTGLQPATSYFYRVVALGSSPASAPSDVEQGLTRPAAPQGLNTLSAQRSRLELRWTASVGADGYRVYRSSSPFGPFDLIDTRTGGASTSSVSDPSSLPPGTMFTYVARAFNASGESNASATLSQITAPAAPTAPAPVATAPTAINVAWAGVPSATSYVVLRTENVGTPFTPVGTTNAPTTNLDDGGLTPNAIYAYKVVASNAGGDSPESGVASALTPNETLPTPTGVTAQAPAPSRIDVAWPAVTGATNYLVRRGTSATGTFTSIASTVNTNFSDSPALQPATTYYYRVIALSPTGQSAPSAPASALTRTAAPANLHTVSAEITSLTLGWDQVTGASGYRVYRESTPGGAFELIETINSGATTTWNSDPHFLPTSTTFHYFVRAVNASGESADSNVHSQITAPAPPGGVRANPTGPTTAVLSWQRVTGATSYRVLRGDSVASTPAEVATVTDPDSAFVDSGLTAHTPYQYSVTAVNAGGTSFGSGTALAYTDYTCDALANHTRDTASSLGDLSGDTDATITTTGVLCREETDWLAFNLAESVTDPLTVAIPLRARIDFSPGPDVNGQEENIRLCVFEGTNPSPIQCSDYGATTVSVPPYFFTQPLTRSDTSSNDSYPFFLRVEGEKLSSNNTYTIRLTGNSN